MFARVPGTLSMLTDSCLIATRSPLDVVVAESKCFPVELEQLGLALAEYLGEVLLHQVVGDHVARSDEGTEEDHVRDLDGSEPFRQFARGDRENLDVAPGRLC